MEEKEGERKKEEEGRGKLHTVNAMKAITCKSLGLDILSIGQESRKYVFFL